MTKYLLAISAPAFEGLYRLIFIVFSTIYCISTADVQFGCDSPQCLSTLVQYQCIVNGSNILTWRILDENMNQIGTARTHLIGGGISSSFSAIGAPADAFSTDLSSESPLTSDIRYTVQESFDGYTIRCEDGAEMRDCTIDIAGTCVFTCNPTKNLLYTCISVRSLSSLL